MRATVLQFLLAQLAVLVRVERCEALGEARHLRLHFFERQYAVIVGIGFLEALIHPLLHVGVQVFTARFVGLFHLVRGDVAVLVQVQLVEPFAGTFSARGGGLGPRHAAISVLVGAHFVARRVTARRFARQGYAREQGRGHEAGRKGGLHLGSPVGNEARTGLTRSARIG